MNTIYLVGFMGVGKSTAGKKLAQKLGFEFIDLDHLFEEKYKISIDNFFKKYGEELFRKMEYEILLTTFNKPNTVISTGGGTPCFYDAMEQINKHGLSIYIKMAPSSIAYRLSEAKKKRPLVGQLKDKEELLDFIVHKLKDREPHYRKARLHVNGVHIDYERLVTDIEKEFKSLLPSS